MHSIVCRLLAVFVIFASVFFPGCNSSSKDTPKASDGAIDLSIDKYAHQVPKVYEETLADYERIVAFRLSSQFEEDYDNGVFPELNDNLEKDIAIADQQFPASDLSYRWHCMLVDMPSGIDAPTVRSYQYVLKDINGDGTHELFWVKENTEILAVFTADSAGATLLDAYWPRYCCTLTDSGQLCTVATSGADRISYRVQQLSKDSVQLITELEFGLDGVDTETKEVIYYQLIDGSKEPITEMRFQELVAAYPFGQEGTHIA